MRAEVSGTWPRASVDTSKIRASISTIAPASGVTYEVPVALVAYVALHRTLTWDAPVAELQYSVMAAQAEVDSAGRNQLRQDELVLVDGASLFVGKGVAESSSPSDDVFAILSKALSDAALSGDSASLTISFMRSFADSVSVTDNLGASLSDLLVISETVSLSHQRTLADAVGINDMADVGDGIVFDFVNNTANVATPVDLASTQIDKPVSETATAADSGSLFNQGYSDVTYFAEEYVGDARAF